MVDQNDFEESDTPTIEVVEQAEIPFLDELLLAVMGTDGEVYCPVVPFCRHLGIVDTKAQTRRIREDETMAEALRLMPIDTPGGKQQTQCLRVDMLVLWLTTIRQNQCKLEVRSTLGYYKREAARAILAYFTAKAQARRAVIIVPEVERPIVPTIDAPVSEWANYHEAMAALYRQMSAQQATLGEQQQTIERHDREIGDLAGMLEGMKEALAVMGEAPEPRISIHQANTLQTLVSKIHEATGLHQGTIFAAFKKQWRLPRYDELPAAQYNAAYEWLRQWGRARLPQKNS